MNKVSHLSRGESILVLCIHLTSFQSILGCTEEVSKTKDSIEFVFGEADIGGTGPFDVGLKTLIFEDDYGQTLTADIWYPAHADKQNELAVYEPTIYTRTAYREAKAANHEAPLVAFSHGLGAIRFQSVYFWDQVLLS